MSFKICNHCGSRLNANDNYCPKCGTQYQATTNTPQPTEVEYQVEQERKNKGWLSSFIGFKGRLPRSIFLKVILGYILTWAIVLGVLMFLAYLEVNHKTRIIPYSVAMGFVKILGLTTIFSLLGISAQRMRDLNYSAWYLVGYYILLGFLSSFHLGNILGIAALLPYLVFAFKDSYPYENKWGKPFKS